MNRFIYNCEKEKNERTKGELTPEAISDSGIQLIRLAQENAFLEEIESVQKEMKLPKKSKLHLLGPWLNENRLLRLSGRLQFAESLPFDTRHPVMLPRGSQS